MSNIKKIVTLVMITLVPNVLIAQEWDATLSNDQFAFASLFAGNFSLLLSAVIGIIATSLVFRAGKKMGGGLFGSVLNYIGVGMICMIIGTLSFVFDIWIGGIWLNIINTVFFAFGYIFIVIGGNKLLKGIINT